MQWKDLKDITTPKQIRDYLIIYVTYLAYGGTQQLVMVVAIVGVLTDGYFN